MSAPVLRVGVVGLGAGSFLHAEPFSKLPEAKLHAFCDQNQTLLDEFGAQYSVPQRFTDFDQFINEAEIDLVALAVPNYLHKPMALAALNRGLHVICEKPMAMDTAEAIEMRAKVRETGKKFMVHFNQRFRAEHQYFRKIIEEGKLGEIYYASAGWRRMRGMPKFGGWFGQKKMSGGGPLIDLGVHMLDLTRWLMGNPRAVTVSACTYAHLGRSMAMAAQKQFDVEDLASALIRFDNGSTLALEVSWALNFEEREKIYMELSGTRGGLSNIIYDYKDTTTCIFREESGAMVKTVPLKYPQTFQNAQAHFIDCILNDREPEAGPDEGVEIMRLLDAIYESARRGREVELRPVDLSVPLPAGPAVAAV